MKYEASVRAAMMAPWTSVSMPMPLAKMPSFELRGLRFMMSGSASSMHMARAGSESVMRLIHSRCVGSRMTKPMSEATNTEMTSARLELSRNWMALRMLS